MSKVITIVDDVVSDPVVGLNGPVTVKITGTKGSATSLKFFATCVDRVTLLPIPAESDYALGKVLDISDDNSEMIFVWNPSASLYAISIVAIDPDVDTNLVVSFT